MSPGAPGQGTDGGVARRGLVSHPGGDKPDRQTDIIKHTYIHTLQTYMHTIHTYTTNIHTLQTYIHTIHTLYLAATEWSRSPGRARMPVH